MTSPLGTEQAQRLGEKIGARTVVTAVSEEADLATSLRPGESPEVIAMEIDGLEYHETRNVGIGRLAEFTLVEP